MTTVAVVCSAASRELDESWPYLRDALLQQGLVPQVVVWDDDADVEWGAYELVVPLYVWGYVSQHQAFLSWVDRVSMQTHLANAPSLLRWSSEKSYLAEMAGAGVPTVPTTWVPPGHDWSPPSDDYVVKPSVASGGLGAARFVDTAPAAAKAHVRRLHEQGQTVMVQPYQATVELKGETALYYFGGVYSHAVCKGALLEADVGPKDELWKGEVITRAEPSALQRAASSNALKMVGEVFGVPAYARVDLIEGVGGDHLVSELELVEPSLFFNLEPPGAARLAATLCQLVLPEEHPLSPG
jgi:hypothetical protein